MNASEENKDLIRRLNDEVFNQGDAEAADKFVAPGFVNHMPNPDGTADLEGWVQPILAARSALDGFHTTSELLIAESDLVVEKYTSTGVHSGDLLGATPTGEMLTMQGINIFRVVDGKITELWGAVDVFGLMRQLKVG